MSDRRYCDGFCQPRTRPLDADEAERGHLCAECADELNARERDAFNRRIGL